MGFPPRKQETTMNCGKCGQEGHDETLCPESTGAGNGPPDDALDAAIHGRPLFRRPGVWVVLGAVVLIGGGLIARNVMKGGSKSETPVAAATAVDAGTENEGQAEEAQAKAAEPAKAGQVVATTTGTTDAKANGKPGAADDKPVAPPATAQANVAPVPTVGTGPVLIVTVDTETWKLKSSTWKVPIVDAEAPVTDDKGVHYKTKAGAKYLFAFAKVDWTKSGPQEVALLKE